MRFLNIYTEYLVVFRVNCRYESSDTEMSIALALGVHWKQRYNEDWNKAHYKLISKSHACN